MAVLYVVEQGATLRKTGDRFVVEKGESQLAAVPAIKVEQVVIFGSVQLTTPALVYMLANGIDATFLSVAGRYYGRLLSVESGFGELRRRYLRLCDDEARSLAVAQAIVAAKLSNGRTLLQRAQRDRPERELALAIDHLEGVIARVGRTTQVSSLVGVEGFGTAMYFRGFKQLLRQDFGFASRVRRPPTDPINVLLSFGYTLLCYSIQAAVQTVGLDPLRRLLARPGLLAPLAGPGFDGGVPAGDRGLHHPAAG